MSLLHPESLSRCIQLVLLMGLSFSLPGVSAQEQDPKGPYLGNIANIYRREDLAKAIMMPGDTIAQGFATYVIELDNGEEVTGFVVQEYGDKLFCAMCSLKLTPLIRRKFFHARS